MTEELATKPHTATAILTIRLHGKQMEWPALALRGLDDERSLRRHLKRWIPAAEWISFRWEDDGR